MMKEYTAIKKINSLLIELSCDELEDLNKDLNHYGEVIKDTTGERRRQWVLYDLAYYIKELKIEKNNEK